MTRRNAVATAVAVLPFICAPVFAGSKLIEQTDTMHRFEDASAVDTSTAILKRMEDGVYTVAKSTELNPGHAITMWFVVFNEPTMCSDGECGENDVFNLNDKGEFIANDDGSAPMNMGMIEKAGISAVRADGRVIGPDGTAVYKGFLPVGDTSDAAFGPGLLDSMKAEVHLVLRDHQVPEASRLSEALNTIHGACDQNWPNAPCTDVQFAVFPPAAMTN